jgi:hypothetical protein
MASQAVESGAAPTTKVCPYCAETDLQLAAKVCKHCGKELDKKPEPAFGRTTWGWSFLALVFLLVGFVWWPGFVLAAFFLLLRVIAH